jgi:hypothetical protein
MTQQKAYDFLVDEFLIFVHLHFGSTKIMQQREPSCFLNDPIRVCSIFYEELCNHEANFFVLKTIVFFYKTIKDDCERVVIERVWFVYLSRGHNEMTNDLIVAVHAGHNQGSLFVYVGLLVDVNIFIF